MRRLFPVLAVAAAAALLSLPAHAGGYASAQAQAGIGYATPQAALAPAYGTCGAGAAPAAPGGCGYGAAALAAPLYAPQQQVIVQRQVVPQAVYVQPQAAVVLRQRAYAPVLQQQIVSPYVPQAQAFSQAGLGYGGGGLAPAAGLFGGGRQRAQKTVTRSRAVTVTRTPGLLNRALGR
jgi:hypothetical protein